MDSRTLAGWSYVEREIETRGWSVTSPRDADGLICLAKQLGRPAAVSSRHEIVQTLVAREPHSRRERSLSGKFGLSSFPWHTDAATWVEPARYLLLYAGENDVTATPTRLVDVVALNFSAEEKDLLGRVPLVVENGRSSLLATVLGPAGLIRYDPVCMRPANSEGRKVVGLLQSRLSQAKAVEISWKKGMVLVVDNARILHARGAVAAPGCRRLQRVLVMQGE